MFNSSTYYGCVYLYIVISPIYMYVWDSDSLKREDASTAILEGSNFSSWQRGSSKNSLIAVSYRKEVGC